MSDLPVMNPKEKAWIEKCLGYPISNEEAQVLIHEARLAAGPYEEWLLHREGKS